jgi:hypothetical protein
MSNRTMPLSRRAGKPRGHRSPPHIESEIRRGRDYVRVTISMMARAPDVAQALTAAWRVFRKAVGDDTAGWDLPGAMAEIRAPGGTNLTSKHGRL